MARQKSITVNDIVLTAWYDGLDRLHRTDGPAIISSKDNAMFWYVNNFRVNSWEEFQRESGISNEQLLQLVIQYGTLKNGPQ